MNESTDQLLTKAIDGDENAFDRLFDRHRDRLRRSIRVSLHPLVRTRVDESDIVQESYIRAITGVRNYDTREGRPFFLWLRFIARQQVLQAHRTHLDAKVRSQHQEILLHAESGLSAVLAANMKMKEEASPLSKIAQEELIQTIHDLLVNSMSERDCEILQMRHFEMLTNEEIAHALDISRSNASTRYVRALTRLRTLIQEKLGSSIDVC